MPRKLIISENLYTFYLLYNLWSCSLVVITFASHASGLGFKSQSSHFSHTEGYLLVHLSWVGNKLGKGLVPSPTLAVINNERGGVRVTSIGAICST